jgi:hypothetical protein
MDVDDDAPVCPPAPKRRARSPTEEAEADSFMAASRYGADHDAYDAVVRQLVNELTVRLEEPPLGGLPPMEGLVSPSGLQRQQAVDPSLPPICSPRQISSPAAVYCVGSGVAVAVPAELDLTEHRGSPVKRRETDSEAASHTGASSPMMRRETDIEGDLSVAATGATTNTAELSSAAEEDEDEGDSVSDDDGGDEESVDEESVSDEGDADDEGGAPEETNTVEHVPADDTNTSGCACQVRRQKHTGELALGVEAPVWMWGAGVAVVTSYLWIVALLIKGGGGR